MLMVNQLFVPLQGLQRGGVVTPEISVPIVFNEESGFCLVNERVALLGPSNPIEVKNKQGTEHKEEHNTLMLSQLTVPLWGLQSGEVVSLEIFLFQPFLIKRVLCGIHQVSLEAKTARTWSLKKNMTC